MSQRSGKSVSRRKVDTYEGFDIIRVTETRYYKSILSGYYTSLIDSQKTYYEFCQEGQSNRPSQAYNAEFKNKQECIDAIDKFIEDDSIYFTHAEREKYVYKPNAKCNYGFGYDTLMKLLKDHQKASKRMKTLIEDRLEDANFHVECGFLSNGDYEGYIDHVRREYKFREKFEVYTATECKRIDNPKKFEEGLANVIEKYLAIQGVKDTSVRVRFVEDW